MEAPPNTLNYQALLNGYSKDEQFRKVLQIADFLSGLPSEEVLKEFCKTEDLQFYWFKLRCFYSHIARCFVILSSQDEVEDYKLRSEEVFKEALKQKQMNRRDVTIYELEAKRLLREWSLIEAGFPYLCTEVANFQFHEDVKLFCELCKEQSVQAIKQPALSYYEILIPERARTFEQAYEAAQGSIEEKNEIQKNPLVYKNDLKKKIIGILHQKSLSDLSLQHKLKDLQTAHNDLDWEAQASCNARKSSGKRLKSEVWKNGERYRLTRQGLEKFSLLEELREHIPESSLQAFKSALQQIQVA